MTEDTAPDPEPDDDSLSYELGELARVLSHVEQQAVDGAVTLAVGGVRWLRDRAEGALRIAEQPDAAGGDAAPAEAGTSPDELYEHLAAYQHEIWAHWMRYLLGTKGQWTPDGGVLLDPADVVHWQTQIETPYAGLTEAEKASDREQVDRFWPLVQALRGRAS